MVLKERGTEWKSQLETVGYRELFVNLHLKVEEVCLSEVKCRDCGMLLQP